MKFHIHMSVADIPQAIDFYSKLFAKAPVKTKTDYAKWSLENPALNFAISSRGQSIGVDHLGFEASNDIELDDLHQRALLARPGDVMEQGLTQCCYAHSDKHWTIDPAGLAWEHFHTIGDVPIYGVDTNKSAQACCVPQAAERADRCCASTNTSLQTAEKGCCGK